MASGKKDSSPPTGDLQLWCNIDDDDSEDNPYIQPARSASKKRKQYSGGSQFSSLLTAESAAASTAPTTTATAAEAQSSSQFGSLPTGETTAEGTTTMPKDPATETQPMPKEPATETEATTDATPLPSSSMEAEQTTTAEATTSEAQNESDAARFSSLLTEAREGNSQTDEANTPQIVVSKQQNKAAALNKIYARQQINKSHEQLLNKLNRQRQPTKKSQSEPGDAAFKKFKLHMKKAKELVAAAPKPPRRPPSPHPVIELSSARDVRTITALKTATVKKFRAWKHRQPPGPTYKPFSKAWKAHPYGERLWNEYQQLEPIVYQRQVEDAAASAAAAATNAAPDANQPQPTTSTDMTEEDRQKQVDELTQKFLQSEESAGMEVTAEELREACAELLSTPNADQPVHNEEMPLEQPPSPSKAMELDLDDLLAVPKTQKPAAGAYRNPSPPRTASARATPPPTESMPQSNPASIPGLAPCRPRDPPDNHKTAHQRVTAWLHSSAAPGQQPPKKDASKSSSREGHESRPQSGGKRTSTTASSTAPPAQRPRGRDVSRSPVRDRSPGVNRKNMLRVQANQPPLPIIDGFMCKDLAVFIKRSGEPFQDAQWTAAMNQPNDQFIFVGGINEVGVPSLYLPTDTLPDGQPKYYKPITVSNRYPLADLTRKEFDEEQSIVPSIFILGHTFGTFPGYATMVTTATRELLCEKIRPTTKLYSSLRVVGIGPTGYDLKGADTTYIQDIKDQRHALVRLGRIARHADRSLVVMITYEGITDNFDPHQDAIDELTRTAELNINHPVHLVSYTGTVRDMLKWLRAFPKVVFGLSFHQLATHARILTSCPPDTQAYKDSAAFRRFLQCIPLSHLAIQSGCPFPIDDEPGRHYSPYQLLGIGDKFAELIMAPLAGAALYAHSAENLRRTYNLSKELLKNLAHAVDQRPDRLTYQHFKIAMDALYMPIAVAVARADPVGQNERRRSSIAEASPMSGVEDGAAAQPQLPQHRSQSARRRKSQSPTKSRDGRGRTTDKHRHQKKGSQLSSLLAVEPAQSSSKAASSADKDNQPSSTKHNAQSSKDAARHHFQGGDHRQQSRTSSRSRSSGRTTRHRGHQDRSPARRDSSRDKRAPPARTPPQKSPPRRRVVLTPSPEPEPYVIRTTTKEAKKPTVMSQIVVPERTRSASTGLRIIVPQEQTFTFQEPRLPARITIAQDQGEDQRRSRSPRTSSLQPTNSRAPVQERIDYREPRPYTTTDTLKELRQRQSGGSLSSLLDLSTAGAKDAPKKSRRRRGAKASAKDISTDNDGPDPLLKPEPVLEDIVPEPGTTEEYLELVDHHFVHEEDPVTGATSSRVIADSLASQPVPRARTDVIQVTHGCDLPWEPNRYCRGLAEAAHFHLTIEESNLLGPKMRWLRSGPVKTDSNLRALVETIYEATVHSFGQMILIKYAARVRLNDPRAGDVVMFVDAVLTATDLEIELPRILAQYQPDIIRPDAKRPWPDQEDFYNAAEHWVCYCEHAFVYLFDRLSGPAVWNTNWMQTNVLPQAARETIISEMVDMAQEHFDKLRHQLYLQYGRQHIEADDRVKFRWSRFDEHLSQRIKIKDEDKLTAPTICFVDEITKATFGDNLRDTVAMITIPDGTSDDVRHFVRRFFLMGTVGRVVFWFGRQLLLNNCMDYYDLIGELCHHLTAYFSTVEQYFVLPAYMRDRFYGWTDGPLAVFVRRAALVPHARVVLDHYDQHMWYGDAKELNRPLPHFIDETGRLLTEQPIAVGKNRMTTQHGLDLWHDAILQPTDPRLGSLPVKVSFPSSAPQRPKTTKKPEKNVPPPLSYSPPPTTSSEKDEGGALSSLLDAPSSSTSAALSANPAAALELLRTDHGLDLLADYIIGKMQARMSAQVDTQLRTVEDAVARAEQEDAEMDDDDALSEPTPYKERDPEE